MWITRTEEKYNRTEENPEIVPPATHICSQFSTTKVQRQANEEKIVFSAKDGATIGKLYAEK